MAVATGNKPVTTQFTIPSNIPEGPYDLSVIANGISSDPIQVKVSAGPTCYLASEVFSYFNKPEAQELEFLLTKFMDGYMQETEERKTVVRLYELIVPNLRKKLHKDPRQHEIFEIAEKLITKGYESAKGGDYDRTYQLYIRALLYSLVYYLCPQYLKITNSNVELDLSKFESDLDLLLK